MSTERHEVVIVGGGLAGLTLALHLKQEFPDLSILVLERQRHPLRPAAHKVGESIVELASYYLHKILGLREHLEGAHIEKFALRYFFSDGRRDIENVLELGARKPLPFPSYQLDRGILETFLGEQATRIGVEFRAGANVTTLNVGNGHTDHTVSFRADDQEFTVSARWLIDASGRGGVLRRRFGLTRDNDHRINAVWFRLATRIDVDRWSDDQEWLRRCNPPERWRSTNHMMGPGYWTWLIPLSSGAHSVGIVADGAMHPLKEMSDFDRALNWLSRRQPIVADAIAGKRDTLLDFSLLRNYSYGCSRVFSANRWALTGEAALFTDPFYSPGSDFIAITNTYIVNLIGHDRQGHNLWPYASAYEHIFLELYRSALTVVRGQYPLFGNPLVFPAKTLWDGAYYWGILCQLALNDRLTDIGLLRELASELAESNALNSSMQDFFRAWHSKCGGSSERGMLDRFDLNWCAELYNTLLVRQERAELVSTVRNNCALLRSLADTIKSQAKSAAGDDRSYAPLVRPPIDCAPGTFIAP